MSQGSVQDGGMNEVVVREFLKQFAGCVVSLAVAWGCVVVLFCLGW